MIQRPLLALDIVNNWLYSHVLYYMVYVMPRNKFENQKLNLDKIVVSFGSTCRIINNNTIWNDEVLFQIIESS